MFFILKNSPYSALTFLLHVINIFLKIEINEFLF